jgi:hypothetical protein
MDLEQGDINFEERQLLDDAKDLCGSLVEIRPDQTVELVHTTAKG